MKFRQIECFNLINDVEVSKVNEIAESIKNNGYVGCPILVCGESLITGSHRLAALKQISETQDINDMIVAEDVSEIIETAMQNFEEQNGYARDWDYSDIGWAFQGTWLEKFKNEIAEW
jgi:hypothetical protein